MSSISFAELRRQWTHIVGPRLATSTWPTLLCENGTLIVATPMAALSLEHHIDRILEALPPIDGRRVSSIRFVPTPPVRADQEARSTAFRRRRSPRR